MNKKFNAVPEACFLLLFPTPQCNKIENINKDQSDESKNEKPRL